MGHYQYKSTMKQGLEMSGKCQKGAENGQIFYQKHMINLILFFSIGSGMNAEHHIKLVDTFIFHPAKDSTF